MFVVDIAGSCGMHFLGVGCGGRHKNGRKTRKSSSRVGRSPLEYARWLNCGLLSIFIRKCVLPDGIFRVIARLGMPMLLG